MRDGPLKELIAAARAVLRRHRQALEALVSASIALADHLSTPTEETP